MDPIQPQGNGSPQEPQGGTPSSVNEERVAEIVNRAISARHKSFQEQFNKQLETSLKGITESISVLAERSAPSPSPSPQGNGEAPKRNRDETVDESPAFKSLQRQFADLKAENERNAQAANAERLKTRDTVLRQRVSESLAEIGIREPARIKQAIHHLVDGEKRIAYDEDSNSLVFRDSDDAVLDLTTGLKSWSKSDDGKHFLPPTGARGSGDGRGPNAPAQRGPVDQDAVWHALTANLLG